MMKQTIQDALNEQIANELYSSYLYLAMAAHFEEQKLPGFAQWMKVQSREEYGHGMRLFNYVIDRGGKVVLKQINSPPDKFGDPTAVFQQILQHEQHVTESIHQLYELALKERDYPTQVHLHWFITEQVEEEKSAEEIVDRLHSIAGQKQLLFLLDQQLGGRAGEGK